MFGALARREVVSCPARMFGATYPRPPRKNEPMAMMKPSWSSTSDEDFYDASDDAQMEDGFDDEVALDTLPDVRPARLLLAEEDDELRRNIAGQLRGKGYQVDEAFSGFEAIALIARQVDAYDLIITDFELHGMNGLELIDELRASPRSSDSEVPVIVIGEEPTGETEREALRLHAVIIEKPFDLEQLSRRAESLARPIQIQAEARAS
jgi:CheY-like chemotaxis protein